MSQDFGISSPDKHHHAPLRKPARYLVIIDAAGIMVARLYLDTRELVAEFDASTEEVAQMVVGLTAAHAAGGPEWDRALEAHSAAERGAAEVFTLDV